MVATFRLMFAAALVALPLWLAGATPAHACVCAIDQSTDPLADLVSRTDIIAIGSVGEMLILPPGSVQHPESLGGRTPVEIKFFVSDFLKGAGANPVLIYQASYQVGYGVTGNITSVSGTDCDLFARLGDQFLLFLYKSDPLRYQTGACSGNMQIVEGQDSSAYIAEVRAAVQRQPGLPNSGAGPSAQRSSSQWLIPLAAGGVGLLASSAFLVLSRRCS